ncbi:endoglucanase C [Kordia sp. SMS9]|uniref:glycosyl hydrolase family 8 n=1 Tax=Kordia sp. SMS9 TaxID=2282170 RepID=UPI000E1064C2|nr:glycosyl hydrolase family 8 [Kordia sp. SMS9]AXG70568.1 endoglucanase C [Kordia sp. SMS9]
MILTILTSFLLFISCSDTFRSNYAYGKLPTNLETARIADTYTIWKDKYVTADGCPEGAKRILFDDMSHTVSEGIGYGMLISAMMKDKATFDAFYTYYNAHLDPNGLMHWKIDANGKRAGDNAATDADVDVAYALLLAHKLIGNESYLAEAKKIIKLIKKYMVEPKTYVLKAGDAWGGSMTTNPSYFAPAYFKVFAEVTNDDFWHKVSDTCYDILFKSWNSKTGLVPDWCKADGTTPADNVSWAKYEGKAYYYDAARTPWRIAKDYVWFGDERAEKYCNVVNRFIEKIGFPNITDGYNLNGSTFRTKKTSAFVGCFAVATLVSNNQQLIDAAYAENINTFNDSYFNDILRLLTLQMQHGMFVRYE